MILGVADLIERVDVAIRCIEEVGDRSPISVDDLRSIREVLVLHSTIASNVAAYIELHSPPTEK